MGKLCEFASLLAVMLLVCFHVSGFDRMDGFIRGPLNPYAFFTDEVRCALEQASDKAIKGELSTKEAKIFLEKWNVCRCYVEGGTVSWTIAYSAVNTVVYVYSPGRPCSSDYQPLWNNWYWGAHLYNSPLSTPRHLVPLFLELRRLAKVAPLPLRLVLRAVEPINMFHSMRILSVGLRPSPRILGNYRGIIQHSGFGAAPQLKIALL